jgi:predicted PurR-regulated permease PerM
MDRSNYPKHPPKSRLAVIIGIIVIAVIFALATVTVLLYKQVQDLRNNPDQAVVEKSNQLKDQVAKIMHLPDETPTIAEIKTEDLDKLKTQAFFRDIKNGDKILIFSKAQKAVIYREEENRIINSGPIVINANNPTEGQNG